MIRKVLHILMFLPVLYLVVLPVLLTVTTSSKLCSEIVIDLKDSSEYHFVTKKQLLSLAYGNSG